MERDGVRLTEDARHQQVLDEAWDWLVVVCNWNLFQEEARYWQVRMCNGDERRVQLQRWNS